MSNKQTDRQTNKQTCRVGVGRPFCFVSKPPPSSRLLLTFTLDPPFLVAVAAVVLTSVVVVDNKVWLNKINSPLKLLHLRLPLSARAWDLAPTPLFFPGIWSRFEEHTPRSASCWDGSELWCFSSSPPFSLSIVPASLPYWQVWCCRTLWSLLAALAQASWWLFHGPSSFLGDVAYVEHVGML